ncbi:DEAH-box RNA-dependent ATPase prp2 [Zygosaccharomyces mellis]|uniref:RNA helicase n=1 Tax=Zygosaccharomyces mellis TaxID=42258 RepID=A0A4C2E0Q5_9SACH|nr:DEAH-box RNA-dependent ATPase prp2 [Zygosaccharomyces mellis]
MDADNTARNEHLQTGKGKRRTKRVFESHDAYTEKPLENNDKQESEKSMIHPVADNTENMNEMKNLRLLARQRYLSHREREKLVVLVKELEYLEQDIDKYGWENLTQGERDDIILKRELVALVEHREGAGVQKFNLQEDYVDDQGKLDVKRKKALLNDRSGYRQHEDEGKRKHMWEEKQLHKAVKKDEDVDEIKLPGADRYEFVFDDNAMVDYEEQKEVLPEKDSEQEIHLLKQLEIEQERITSVQETRKVLPVYGYRKELLEAIKEHQTLIIVGETGSGKTTQLPQYLVEDGYTQGGKFRIAVTQPRRVAATAVAARVADEMDVVLGKEVGYSIRFEDKTMADRTILKYMTDGMLLREFLVDPELQKYSCIMIDEAHERTLATDILLGLLKDILPHRKDLKLLISSATMNATKFSRFFNNCPIFNVPGRRFPVDIHYTVQPEANYLHAVISTVFQIHTKEPVPGDILVFLTGQDEIENIAEKMEMIAGKLGEKAMPLIITPIYANLPQDQQNRIFIPTPPSCRKVVLATNIAETSLTVEGIKYVVDPGYVKENSFVPSTGMTQLLTVPCSRASVDQRAGRAGRVGPGKCYRIFTKWSYYNELELMPRPEIVRTNLSSVVLLLLSLGITNLVNFQLLDKPSVSSLSKSLENLYLLGALNSKGTITKLGRIMCEFPCEPEFAKVLHTAATHEMCHGVLEECIDIVAMLHETKSLFMGSKNQNPGLRIIGQTDSDHMLYWEIYDEWRNSNYSKMWCQDHKLQYKTLCRVRNIRDQLLQCADKLGLAALNESARRELVDKQSGSALTARITKCFISGFPMNIAQLGINSYRTVGKKSTSGLDVYIHPSSVVFQSKRDGKKPCKFVLYQQLMLTSKEFIRDCLPIIKESWLEEMVPQLFRSR